jgi:NMD protein affecting ribosome stability and mRNA decay
MRPDWTVPFDDILTVRFRVCVVCAQPADEMDLWSAPSGEAMAIAMCRRCGDADAIGARRTALVEEQAQRRLRAVLDAAPQPRQVVRN